MQVRQAPDDGGDVVAGGLGLLSRRALEGHEGGAGGLGLDDPSGDRRGSAPASRAERY